MLITDPERLGALTLPDGRALGWSEWGPADGTPVLLCPGAATSRHLGFGADVLHEFGVRLVSADRPGLGASDPLPGRTFDDVAADLTALCAGRGLGRPAVVGNSQGAPFALAFAAAGGARTLSIVSGADEAATEPDLPEDLAALVALAGTDPAAAEAALGSFDAATMLEMVLAASHPADVAVYTEPAFAAAYRRALDEAFAAGPAGYARDTVLSMRRWPFDLAALGCPVRISYGALDTGHSRPPAHHRPQRPHDVRIPVLTTVPGWPPASPARTARWCRVTAARCCGRTRPRSCAVRSPEREKLSVSPGRITAMTDGTTSTPAGTVALRAVTEDDLETFLAFEHDPEAAERANFPPQERERFLAHWRTRVLGDPTGLVRAITVDGALAGNAVAWWAEDRRFVGYWLGREFWGRGIGTAAIREFLRLEQHRPLWADPAARNPASVRLLEKLGFVEVQRVDYDGVQHVMLRLD